MKHKVVIVECDQGLAQWECGIAAQLDAGFEPYGPPFRNPYPDGNLCLMMIRETYEGQEDDKRVFDQLNLDLFHSAPVQ